MLRHNLLIIFRNFRKNKSTFLINLIGLSTGLACALLIYLWVNDELNVDKYNKKDSQLYQVMIRNEEPEGIRVTPELPPVLAETLVKELPEVKDAVNEGIMPGESLLSFKEKHLKASGIFAGRDYFNLFLYKLIQGNKNQVLSDGRSIVVSKNLALRFFNTTENIIGKPIGFEDKGQFYISGIFTVPSNSSKQFDFLLPFKTTYKLYPNFKKTWNNSWPYVYLLLQKGTDIKQFNKKMNTVVKPGKNQLFVRKFSDAYLFGKYTNGVQSGGRIEYVRLFTVIGIFILLIACINFMNLSTARASRRIREVGIKKTLGVSRKTLIFQYLGESITTAMFSLFAAVIFAELALPYFNGITGKQISLSFNTNIILSFLLISLLTGIISGSYPAFYLSGFKPIAVLRGKLQTSFSELWIRKGLVIFQFTLSVILIVAVLIVYNQMKLIQDKNLGYNKDNIICFTMEGNVIEHREAFLSEIKNIPGVKNASSTWLTFLGQLNSTDDLYWQGKNPKESISMQYRRLNYGMIELLGIKMKEGRSFSKNFSQNPPEIIFNETAVKLMGLKNPVGKTIKLWNREYEISGVAKDFNFESIHDNVKPLFMFLNPARTNTIMIKIEKGKLAGTLNRLKDFYGEFTQGLPFDYRFLDDLFQEQYSAEKRVSELSKYFAGLAIIISCLGLFGLSAFTAQKRNKEIGIRKILGSSELGIIYLLSSDFTKLVLASILIAMPLSYYLAGNWLDSFVYRIDLSPLYFVSTGIITLVIAWFTVGTQALKAARVNPSQCLRDE